MRRCEELLANLALVGLFAITFSQGGESQRRV
jgi:hypothetical protein